MQIIQFMVFNKTSNMIFVKKKKNALCFNKKCIYMDYFIRTDFGVEKKYKF